MILIINNDSYKTNSSSSAVASTSKPHSAVEVDTVDSVYSVISIVVLG